MDSAGVQIRALSPMDAPLYRDIRLEALRQNPEAFGSTFERESAQPVAWFEDRLGGGRVFGALLVTRLEGVCGFYIPDGTKSAHKGVIWGTYVRPAARNAGIGRRLVETVVAAASHEVEILQLAVVSENEDARRLYTGLGFVEYGIERRALKQNGRYYDEVLMAKALTGVPD